MITYVPRRPVPPTITTLYPVDIVRVGLDESIDANLMEVEREDHASVRTV